LDQTCIERREDQLVLNANDVVSVADISFSHLVPTLLHHSERLFTAV